MNYGRKTINDPRRRKMGDKFVCYHFESIAVKPFPQKQVRKLLQFFHAFSKRVLLSDKCSTVVNMTHIFTK